MLAQSLEKLLIQKNLKVIRKKIKFKNILIKAFVYKENLASVNYSNHAIIKFTKLQIWFCGIP